MCLSDPGVRSENREITISSSAGFPNLSTTDVVGQIILGGGGCPGPCRMFSSAHDFYPLEARSTIPSCDHRKCLQTRPNSPRRAQSLPSREALHCKYEGCVNAWGHE